jgi:hypothetical protein
VAILYVTNITDVLWFSRMSPWYPSQQIRKLDIMQRKTRRCRKSWYDYYSSDDFLSARRLIALSFITFT